MVPDYRLPEHKLVLLQKLAYKLIDENLELGDELITSQHVPGDIGRHYRDHSDKVTIPETLHADQIKETQVRDIELKAGQMVIFVVCMAHGSSVNKSTGRRIGYALRYMPATSYYDHHDIPIEDSRGSAHHTRPLIQVRGVDRTGLNDFTMGHPNY